MTTMVTRAINTSWTPSLLPIMVQLGEGVTRSLWKISFSRSRAMEFEYPIRPMAFSPRVMALARTKAPPVFSINAFQAMTIMTGRRMTITEARRLRHWVVRSALKRDMNTSREEGRMRGAVWVPGWSMIREGEVVDMGNVLLAVVEYCYARTSAPVRPMKTSSRVIFPRREAAMTSG